MRYKEEQIMEKFSEEMQQYIANNYLQAETMDLNTPLTAGQKAYLAGAIVN